MADTHRISQRPGELPPAPRRAPAAVRARAPRRRAHRRLVLAARTRRPGRRATTSRPRTRTPRLRSRTSPRSASELFEEIRGRVRRPTPPRPCATAPHEYFRRTREGLQYPVHCRRPAGTPGLPDPDAEPAPTRRDRAARRERARRRLRVLRARRALAVARPAPARLLHRLHGRRALRAALPRPRRRRRPPRRRPRHVLRRSAGPTTTRPSSTRVPTTRCARGRCGVTGSARPRPTTSSCFEEARRALLRGDRSDPQRPVPPDHRRRRSSRPRCGSSTPTRPSEPFRVVTPRRDGVEYHVEHHGPTATATDFFVLTNDDAENFRLMVTPAATPGTRALDRGRRPPRGHASRRRRRVRAAISCLSERADALEQLRVLELAHRRPTTSSTMPDDGVLGRARRQPRVRHDVVRLEYTSLVRPPSSFDYDLVDRALDARARATRRGLRPRVRSRRRREWATATDGTRIPISIVHRRDLVRDGQRADAAVRLRRVRDLGRSDVLDRPTQPARPRCGVRDRARARRRRGRPPVVRGRQAHQQAQLVHRLRGQRRVIWSPRATRARTGSPHAAEAPAGCSWARSRTSRRAVPRAIVAEVPVRRLPHHDPRPRAAAHRHRVGGVGQPAHRSRDLRVHQERTRRTTTSSRLHTPRCS